MSASSTETTNILKKRAALAAINLIEPDSIVGVGTGSTTDFFIAGLASIKHRIEACVASSESTAKQLKALDIRVVPLNSVNEIHIYVDSADEVDPNLNLIKGGGGALTREKIIASAANRFVCIVDQFKQVDVLGAFPLPLEVIPMARSYVARELAKLGGSPAYRESFVTDNHNVILDIYHLQIAEPLKLEQQLNQISGIVTNGIFSSCRPDLVLVGEENEVRQIYPPSP